MADRPGRLNIGSGRTFDEAALNIDILAAAGPDIVADMSRPDLVGLTFQTHRFGAVELAAGSFEHIHASHVLEHVPDLLGLMTNCLALLAEGGRMSVRVPYDLSHGAWQDPTHVRAFNERSWLYYTDWHWQIGWEEDRFDLVNQQLVLGPLGIALRKEGMSPEEIRLRPRTVMEISAEFAKRRLTEEERTAGRTAARGHLDRLPELGAVAPGRPSRRAPAAAARYLDLLTALVGEAAPGRDLQTLSQLAGAAFDAGLDGDFLAVGHVADGAVLAGARAARSAPGHTWIVLPEAEPGRRVLDRVRLDDPATHLLAGPAAETLPFAPFERLALMVLAGSADAVAPLLPYVFDRLVPGGTILTEAGGEPALAGFLGRRGLMDRPPEAAGDWISWQRAQQPA